MIKVVRHGVHRLKSGGWFASNVDPCEAIEQTGSIVEVENGEEK